MVDSGNYGQKWPNCVIAAWDMQKMTFYECFSRSLKINLKEVWIIKDKALQQPLDRNAKKHQADCLSSLEYLFMTFPQLILQQISVTSIEKKQNPNFKVTYNQIEFLDNDHHELESQKKKSHLNTHFAVNLFQV